MKWVGRRLGQGLIEGILIAIRDFLDQLLASQNTEDKKDIDERDPVKLSSDAAEEKQRAHDILTGRRWK